MNKPQGERLTRENEDNKGLICVLLGAVVLASVICYMVIGLGWVL